jgi:hypothetical protein
VKRRAGLPSSSKRECFSTTTIRGHGREKPGATPHGPDPRPWPRAADAEGWNTAVRDTPAKPSPVQRQWRASVRSVLALPLVCGERPNFRRAPSNAVKKSEAGRRVPARPSRWVCVRGVSPAAQRRSERSESAVSARPAWMITSSVARPAQRGGTPCDLPSRNS